MEFKKGDLVKYKNVGLFKFVHYVNIYKKWCVIDNAFDNPKGGCESLASRTHHISIPTPEDMAEFIALKLKG